jgi:hypothetical protein
LDGMRAEIDGLNLQIARVDDRITLLERRRNEKMDDYIPELMEAKNEEYTRLHAQATEKLAAFRKLKAEMLLAAVQLHEEHREYSQIRSELGRVATVIGYRLPTDFSALPTVVVVNHYQPETAIAPSERELEDAVGAGKLPAWVEWYGLTGAVVSEQEAHHLLREAKGTK